MNITGTDIAKVRHQQLVNFDRPFTVTGVVIDSRSVKTGDLFVALKGERVDGHDFLTKAVQAGAAAIMVEKRWAFLNEGLLLSLPVPQLIVENTVRGLGELARFYRSSFNIPVIAVGGSNGKTTTKDMIADVLSEKYSVLATEGNFNNHLGVPLTVFRMDSTHDIAVMEVGTNHPGEITNLCEILLPTHGLITNIGHEHLEFFKNVGGVAKAEIELFDWLKTYRSRDGKVFLNKDDRHLAKQTRGLRSAVTYGFSAKDVTVRGSAPKLSGTACAEFQISSGDRSGLTIDLAVPGIHFAHNALAAVAVGLTFRVPGKKIQDALHAFRPAGKRMEVVTIRGITIINDTYNSNPDSVRAALETLSAMNTAGKRIAVLADMLELGPGADALHRQVADHARGAGIDYLLTYGPLSKATHESSRANFKAHYDQKNMLSEYLAELVSANDVVLIKGSRGMKMEDVVTFLKERFSKAA